MLPIRTLAASLVVLLLGASGLHAEALLNYRQFVLGDSLASVTKALVRSSEDVRVIHERPALIQEVRWRPNAYHAGAAPGDPVREVTFSFCDDQLFRVVVDYDRGRIEGLTDADVVESLAAVYGPPLLATRSLPTGSPAPDPTLERVVARWGTTESSVALLRGTYPTSLRLVLSLTRLHGLADAAATEAIQQDLADAPEREADRKRKAAEDARVTAERARTVNRPAFKP